MHVHREGSIRGIPISEDIQQTCPLCLKSDPLSAATQLLQSNVAVSCDGGSFAPKLPLLAPPPIKLPPVDLNLRKIGWIESFVTFDPDL